MKFCLLFDMEMKFIFLEKFGGRLNSKVCYDATIRLPRLPSSNLRVVTWGRAKASLYCNNDVIIRTLGKVGQNLQFLSVCIILLLI